MDDMTVYIQNLENRTGAWFNLPIDYEEVREKIGLDIESEAYEIQDCDTPFPVDRYTSISEVNRLWEIISDLPEEI